MVATFPIVIEEMTLDDIDGVQDVERASFPVPWPANAFRHELTQNKNARYLVAREGERIVLWLPGSREGDYRHWERVSSVARAEVSVAQGICSIPANSVRAREPCAGFLGKLWQRWRGPVRGRAWILPHGRSAEQRGERATDVVLAWAADGAVLDEVRVRLHWPESKRLEQLGAPRRPPSS